MSDFREAAVPAALDGQIYILEIVAVDGIAGNVAGRRIYGHIGNCHEGRQTVEIALFHFRRQDDGAAEIAEIDFLQGRFK